MPHTIRRRRRSAAYLLTLAAALAALAAAELTYAGEAHSPGEADFRQGWLVYASPSVDRQLAGSLEARQQARLAALPHFEAAVAAEPDRSEYLRSLVYVQLAAGQYQRARETVGRALRLRRDLPELHLLRGQAEAALALMDPAHASERVGPALDAFDQAGRLDPDNALPLIQAASVAFDLGRPDLGLSRVRDGLTRSGCCLRRLPVPFDLKPDRVAALSMWQYVVYEDWYNVLARCQNVSRSLLKLGQEAEAQGELAQAEERFQQALSLGRQLGMADPNLFITAMYGMNVMDDAYAALAGLAARQGSRERERWEGERGVIAFARSQLIAALQAYQKEIQEHPPATPEELLAAEGKHVAAVIAGIGLKPRQAPLRPMAGAG